MIFHTPAGIGDVSWLYSKLKHLGKNEWLIADGWPHRTAPFLNLLPEVTSAAYGPFTYDMILKMESHHAVGISPWWSDVKRSDLYNLYIECNRHLEAGHRLETWMPDLPTDFHYEINVPEEERLKAERLLAGLPKPIWGISAASYRGSEAWKTWGFDEWSTFLQQWEELAGGTILLMGGFWDDLTHSLSENGRYKDIVGKTSVPTMIEVLRQLDGYIGFSSGMGILRTVMNKPAFMLWPHHQLDLSTTWAPIEMLENDKYMAALWRHPAEVFAQAKVWHRSNYGNK